MHPSRFLHGGLFAALLSGAALAQNDECSGALVLTPGATAFDTTTATTSPETWPCASGGADLWYTYTATTTNDVRFETCGSLFDTALQVFTGDCGTLTSVACNDDACSLQSAILVGNVAVGTTFYVRVGGFNAAVGTGTLTLSLIAPPPPAPLGCAESTFTSNNGGAVGGAVYFDVTITEDVFISGLEVNTGLAAGTPIGLTLYTTPGTYVGANSNIGLWTLQARDNGASVSAGFNNRTPVTFDTVQQLSPGSYGFALVGSNSVTGLTMSFRYTNGTGTNQTASSLNGAIQLSLGGATNTAFSTQLFSPRVANIRLCGATCEPPATADVQLSLLGSVDLASTANNANPEYIGSNPSSVAWDGSTLFVAGFNSAGVTANTGIVAVTDPLGTPAISPAFGVLSTPNLRGYSGLDISSVGLAAAWDNGAASADGISLYNTATATRIWAKTGRGGSGVGIDPGFQGVDSGIGWTTFGSGRRILQDAVTGADIYTSATGMIVNGAGTGTFWRDMEFHDATGDIWLREGNNLIKATRTGGNSAMTAMLVVDEPEADSVAGQNVAYLSGLGREVVVYNDREVTSPGQSFTDVVKFVFPSGAVATVDYGVFAPASGVGYYDFSWDEATQTLAVLDFANRVAHIFRVSTDIGQVCCEAAPNATGVGAQLRATGSLVTTLNDITVTVSELPANTFSVVLAARGLGFVPFAGGGRGHLCLSGPIGRGVGGAIFNSGAAGSFSTGFDLTQVPTPLGPVSAMAGETWYLQASYRDSTSAGATFNFTNALGLTLQ